jgi:hypothetical protein
VLTICECKGDVEGQRAAVIGRAAEQVEIAVAVIAEAVLTLRHQYDRVLPHHALGLACRSRCIEHDGSENRVDRVGRIVPVERARIAVEARARGAGRQTRRDVPCRCGRGQVDELALHDPRLRLAIGQDVGGLARRKVPIDRGQAQAAALAREIGLDELRNIAAEQCDAIAGNQAGGAKMGEQPVGVAVEFGEAAVASRRKKRRAIAVPSRPMAEQHALSGKSEKLFGRRLNRGHDGRRAIDHNRLV